MRAKCPAHDTCLCGGSDRLDRQRGDQAILQSAEFELTGAIARRLAGEDVGAVLGLSPSGVKIAPGLDEALQAITAALAKHCALLAARHLPSWEIVDYADAGKDRCAERHDARIGGRTGRGW